MGQTGTGHKGVTNMKNTANTANTGKTRAEEIKSAQAGNDDAAQRLADKVRARRDAQTAHDDVSMGRVRITEVSARKGLLTDSAQAERNANARDKAAKPATGLALTVLGLLKGGKHPHEIVSLEGVMRIDRLHVILTDEGMSGYRFTLVCTAQDKNGNTLKDDDGNAKTQRTHFEVLNLTGGEKAVNTVTASDMKASQDNATPAELMRAAIAKAEAKGKLSARLREWKATLAGAAQA